MPVSTFRRHARHSRHRSGKRSPILVGIRVVAKIQERGMRAPYTDDVATPKINRQAWASAVADLIKAESGGNQTQFAAAVNVHRKTVARWLDAKNDVSEQSVRDVARRLGISAGDLLVRVGYYRPEDLPAAAQSPIATEDDVAMKAVREAKVPLSVKTDIIAHLERQRAEHEKQRYEEALRLLDFARRRRRD